MGLLPAEVMFPGVYRQHAFAGRVRFARRPRISALIDLFPVNAAVRRAATLLVGREVLMSVRSRQRAADDRRPSGAEP